RATSPRISRSASPAAPTTNWVVGPIARDRRIEPPTLEGEPPGPLELRQQVSPEVLLSRQRPDVAAAGRLEVDRHAAGEPHRRLDLAALGSRQELHVYVAAEALAAAQEIDRGETAIGH